MCIRDSRLHLTESKRSGDGPLWELYSSFAIGGKRHAWPLQRQVALAMKRFPFKRFTQWNLVTSNDQRVVLNQQLNRHFYAESRQEGLWLPKSAKKAANEPQGYWLHKGLILIGYMPQGVKAGFHNGQLMEVQGLPDEQGYVELRDIERPAVNGRVTLKFLADFWRLAYAFTGYSAQGRSLGNEATETEPERGLTVHTSHKKFCKRALFTGISRCRSVAVLQVC